MANSHRLGIAIATQICYCSKMSVTTSELLVPGYLYDTNPVDSGEMADLMNVSFPANPLTRRDLDTFDVLARRIGIESATVAIRSDSGQLVGAGCLLYMGLQGELCDLSVLPDHRGNGLGKALVARRLQIAEERNVDSLYMPYLEPTNTIGHYYLERGFRWTDAGELVRGSNPVSIVYRVPQI